MEKPIHALKDLFAQLGLPNDAAAIDAFIKAHSPLAETVKVADAPFWTTAQAAFPPPWVKWPKTLAAACWILPRLR